MNCQLFDENGSGDEYIDALYDDIYNDDIEDIDDNGEANHENDQEDPLMVLSLI